MSRLSRFKDRLGRLGGKQKDPGNAPTNASATAAQTATIGVPPAAHSPRLQSTEGGSLNLVNYSQEELLQQIDRTLSTIQFGWLVENCQMDGRF